MYPVPGWGQLQSPGLALLGGGGAACMLPPQTVCVGETRQAGQLSGPPAAGGGPVWAGLQVIEGKAMYPGISGIRLCRGGERSCKHLDFSPVLKENCFLKVLAVSKCPKSSPRCCCSGYEGQHTNHPKWL